MPVITYPQYRKYSHERTYFKIISDSEWEELHISKGVVTVHSFVAKILPDRNYIYDMTFDYEKNWVKIKEWEYLKVKGNYNL